MTELIDTTEMYLRTIYELEEEGIVPLRARIAERLGHSGPTVSQTVARMERDNLLAVGPDRQLELTDLGRQRATRVMRKHRLAECLLTDIIGLDWDQVHQEACRWEHVMSQAVERRLVEVLGDPTLSPFGAPIPAREEIGGGRVGPGFLDGVKPLSKLIAPDAEPTLVKVVRLGESIQNDVAVLGGLAQAGARPGAYMVAAASAEDWQLSLAVPDSPSAPSGPSIPSRPSEPPVQPGQTVAHLGLAAARHIYVELIEKG